MARTASSGARNGLALGGLSLAGLGAAAAGFSLRRRFDRWAIASLPRPPRDTMRADPADFGLPYEDVQFSSEDGIELRGWLIHAAGAAETAQPTIIMGHGYSGNKDANLGYAAF